METTEDNKLDLSGQCLKKIPRMPSAEGACKITELHLDNNEFQKLENINQFPSVVELSATHNRIQRMSPITPLRHIVKLDLSHNSLFNIEGLKEMTHLKVLNLADNRIKSIERLSTNIELETLDLSENNISSVANISVLVKLKKLYLHKNEITHLKHCEVYLPNSLEVLSLAGNKIYDLNEVSHLVGLVNLRELSIVSNPCVSGNENSTFDYRPFVVNWILGLKVVDGFAVDDIECLKAEWLYSQGRGRQFKPGKHAELVQYLTETCPLNCNTLQTEHERKLRLILSKAQHHQKQLRLSEQPAGCKSLKSSVCELMSRSLDPALLDSCSIHMKDESEALSQSQNGEQMLSRSLHVESVCSNTDTSSEEPTTVKYIAAPAPLPAASKLVPVPESLVSPMVSVTPPMPQMVGPPTTSQEKVSAAKLVTIKNKAEMKRVKKDDLSERAEQAAICIQKRWRGYHTRNLNPKVLSIYQHMQTHRTYQYIHKLSEDMEATRAALDSEHKLQLLQMQAINALWKKVVSLQPSKLDESMGDVKDLAQTCDNLNTQVQQLRSCMQEVLRCVSPSGRGSAAGTQTDIVAVHTPSEEQADKFPYSRPSSLPLPPPQVSQFANCLASDVIKDTVNSTVNEDK